VVPGINFQRGSIKSHPFVNLNICCVILNYSSSHANKPNIIHELHVKVTFATLTNLYKALSSKNGCFQSVRE